MTYEERQYRKVRYAVLGFVGLVVGVFVIISSQLWAPITQWLRPMAVHCSCAILHPLVNPLATGGAGLLLAAMALVAWRLSAAAGRHGWRSWRQSRFFHQANHRVVEHQPTGERYTLLDSPEAQAVTVGLWRPRVYLTTGLIQALTKSEVQAVIRHEQVHRRVRDPLWTAILSSVDRGFGWLPWVRSWISQAYRWRELAADAAATDGYVQTIGLSGAFVKLATAAAPMVGTPFSPNADRVEKLLNPSWRPPLQIWRLSTMIGIAVFFTAAFVFAHFAQASATPSTSQATAACQQTQRMCRSPLAPGGAPQTVCANGYCASFERLSVNHAPLQSLR